MNWEKRGLEKQVEKNVSYKSEQASHKTILRRSDMFTLQYLQRWPGVEKS
jgi:hypothetical protein